MTRPEALIVHVPINALVARLEGERRVLEHAQALVRSKSHYLCYEVWYSRIARHRAKHATVAPPLKDDSIVTSGESAPTWKGPTRWPHDALSTPELPAGEDAFDEDDAIPIVRRELLVSERDAAPERGPGRGSGSAG